MVAAPSSLHTPNRTSALVVHENEVTVACFRVRVVEGPDRGLEVEVEDGELTVGTAPGNQLVLTDPTVSRHHAALTATPDGFTLRDLGSTNGTMLGGYRVQTAYLGPGALVGLGRSVVAFDILDRQVREPLSPSGRFGAVIGQSVSMRRIFSLLERVAPTDTTVLLLGETGTGKSAIAESIHQLSPRAAAPFVVVDCGAIPPSLLESELFGHERGAFTGAHMSRAGQFEAAEGGTIFLDEIGELPLEMQPKLLRALDKRVIRRVGSLQPIPVNVRIIAATNRDLRREVNRGTFRADLFYRLNIAGVTVPSLRDRREDIPALVAHFWSELAGPGAEPPAELLTRFARQDWPGNVRELRNTVERSILLDDDHDGAGEDAAPRASMPSAAASGPVFDPSVPFRDAKEAIVSRWEKRYLEELLERCRGNVSRAARMARMDRNYLRELVRRHGLGATPEE